MEAAIERSNNATRFYTPSAPIIGLNARTQATAGPTNPAQFDRSNIFEAQRATAADEEEEEEDFIDEYQDMASGGSDVMDELEDSTESP